MKKTPPKGPGVSKGKKAKPKKPATPEQKKRGRPTKYRPEFAKQAEKICELGATDADLAAFFEVSEQTINTWKATHPAFLESLKRAKDNADTLVEQSLFHRARGYSHPAVKILTVAVGGNAGSEVQEVPYTEHYPPDTTACIFWLKNRKSAQWRDKVEHTGGSNPDDTPIALALETTESLRQKALDKMHAIVSNGGTEAQRAAPAIT